ncbi:phosphoribosyl-ATP pyrophosphohydrolase [Maricaulis sp.]|uniref:phosphoribosyl-ATP pyrophosphohydrolase n=1 Tax=Maricaulis sp. TaxID=1486257 RepID=UPI001B29E3FB|nr:phosphoribosyl-ATP pyrophosphohydrolase [Maricaulis sp.]MBO6796739.1 phosphoribosyl-ATP pyrophosphohydrolase [Maricaulis sp.]
MSGALGDLAERIRRVSDIYARKYDIDRSGDWHLLKLQEEMGELTQAYLTASGRTRRPADNAAREQLALEMADTLGMLLLLARDEGIDLDAAVQAKWLDWLEPESA